MGLRTVVFFARLAVIFLWFFTCSTLGYFLVLWRRVITRHHANAEIAILNISCDITHLFSRPILRFCGIRVVVENHELLEARKPCIYVSNHQSGMDILTVGSVFPQRTIVIGKKSLFWVPIFGPFFVLAGNIVINRRKTRKAIAGLSQAVRRIRDHGACIWVFPEGTRNRTDQPLLPFKKGAFHMAIAAQVPIVPIVSSPLHPIISWKDRRLNPGTVRLRVLPAIETRDLTSADVDRLAADVRAKVLEAVLSLK